DDFFFFVSRKNKIRFKLLNTSLKWLFPALLFEFMTAFFRKSDPEKPLSMKNLSLREELHRKIILFCSALKDNFGNILEILEKRRDRTKKIYPRHGSY
ncbi:hypothetical protein AKJ51_04425, partial [candidate division MSBL1 archaeon SCGC-AAA382A20]